MRKSVVKFFSNFILQKFINHKLIIHYGIRNSYFINISTLTPIRLASPISSFDISSINFTKFYHIQWNYWTDFDTYCRPYFEGIFFLASIKSRTKITSLFGVAFSIFLSEFLILLYFIWINLTTNEAMQSQFLQFSSTSKFLDFMIENPAGGISVLVGTLSIITVYLYFFTILGKTKYFSELTEVQEKYAHCFWRLSIISIFGGLVILIVISSITKTPNPLDGALFCAGFLNMIFLLMIPVILKNNFFNSNQSENKTLKKGNYFYKFLEDFQKETIPENWSSDIILVLTCLWVIIAVLFNCNIFLLLMVEFSLLVAHFWSSQITLLPHTKTTIELLPDNLGNSTKITNVFILLESTKGYFVVLDEKNQTYWIMKNSIHKLIDKGEAGKKDNDSPSCL
jgi:hypothetical protein